MYLSSWFSANPCTPQLPYSARQLLSDLRHLDLGQDISGCFALEMKETSVPLPVLESKKFEVELPCRQWCLKKRDGKALVLRQPSDIARSLPASTNRDWSRRSVLPLVVGRPACCTASIPVTSATSIGVSSSKGHSLLPSCKRVLVLLVGLLAPLDGVTHLATGRLLDEAIANEA